MASFGEPLQPPKPKLLTVSHSQVGVWNRCQKAWEYNYLQEIVPKKKKATYDLGILVHELTAIYDQVVFHGAVPVGDELAWEQVAKYVEESWEVGKEVLADNINLYHSALQATRRYITEFSKVVDRHVKIVGVEDHFEIELKTPKGRDFVLQGFIDRAHREEGKFWLLDRKTSAQGRHYTENQLLMDSQLLIYAAAYEMLGIQVFGVAVDSISTYPYKDYFAQPIEKVMKRLKTYRSPAELRFILHHYGETVDEILDKLESDGPFVRNLSRDCQYCQYMELCLYAMKDIDTEYLLEANFQKKEPRKLVIPALTA